MWRYSKSDIVFMVVNMWEIWACFIYKIVGLFFNFIKLSLVNMKKAYMLIFGILDGEITNGELVKLIVSWWRHQMKTFSALLAICARNSPVTGEFPSQTPVTRSFDVFFDLHQNKRLRQQSWGWWFVTPSCSLWRHCNDTLACRCTLSWIQYIDIGGKLHGFSYTGFFYFKMFEQNNHKISKLASVFVSSNRV